MLKVSAGTVKILGSERPLFGKFGTTPQDPWKFLEPEGPIFWKSWDPNSQRIPFWQFFGSEGYLFGKFGTASQVSWKILESEGLLQNSPKGPWDRQNFSRPQGPFKTCQKGALRVLKNFTSPAGPFEICQKGALEIPKFSMAPGGRLKLVKKGPFGPKFSTPPSDPFTTCQKGALPKFAQRGSFGLMILLLTVNEVKKKKTII